MGRSVLSRLRTRWRISLTLLLCAAALTLRVSRTADVTADFPHHSPTALAHFLADFTNHPRLYSHITDSWWIEEEVNNFTSWRYVVSYECGPRCLGRVTLVAQNDAHTHHVRILDTHCYKPPLLPWPQICENLEADMSITPRRGGGAHLVEHAVAQCGVLTFAKCDVRSARQQHLRALREALALEA